MLVDRFVGKMVADRDSDVLVSLADELLKSKEELHVVSGFTSVQDVVDASLDNGGYSLDSWQLVLFFVNSSVGMREMLGPRTVLIGTGTIISEREEQTI